MRRLLTAVVTVSAISACGDPFSPEDVAGCYVLETLNGSPPPTPPPPAPHPNRTISLVADGTFRLSLEEVNIRVITGVRETESGTFTLVEPSTIHLTSDSGGVISGTLDGDRLTLIGVDGHTLIFREAGDQASCQL